MIRKEGKVFDSVRARLRARGIDTEGLEVYCTNRGSYHYVILNGENIGEYNHISKRLTLYQDVIGNAPE